MYYLDEVRPQYRNGGDTPKKKQDPRPNSNNRNTYEQSYSNYVQTNPYVTINGKKIATNRFGEWPSYLAFYESTYDQNAANSQGYQGYYALRGMKGKKGSVQHNALFKHVDKEVKSLTKEDLTRARKLGWNDSEILTKMHLFPMGVADYVWANYDSSDDNGTKVSQYGNGIPSIDVLNNLVTKNAIQGDYYILKPGESIGAIAPYVRIQGQRPSQNVPYLTQINASKYNNRRKMSIKGQQPQKRKLSDKDLGRVDNIVFNAGDTIYFKK